MEAKIKEFVLYNVLDFRYYQLMFDYFSFFHPRDFDYEIINNKLDQLETINLNFSFSQFPHPFVIRFIQLLPSLTLHLFSFTSKSNYRNCLLQRGLEFENFNYETKDLEILITKNGRLFFCSGTIPDKLLPYIRPMALLHFNNDSIAFAEMPFRRDYFAISVWFDSPEFLSFLPKVCHSKIKTARLLLLFKVENLEEILNFFNEVEEFYIFIKEMNSKISVVDIKNILEKWKSQKTKKLKRFVMRFDNKLIIFIKNEFMIVKTYFCINHIFFAINDFRDSRQDLDSVLFYEFLCFLKENKIST